MGDVTFTAMTAFDSAMRLELNQQAPLLYSTAKKRSVAGSEKVKLDNLVDNASTRKKTERNGQVVHDQTGYDGIWVCAPEPDYLATLVDNQDQLVTMCDLQGAEVMRHAGAINRAKEAAFITGFFGDMITGKTGTTLNSFPSGNVVAVDHDGAGGATPIGMNLAKIRRARRLLAENYVNMQQRFYIGMTALQVEEITSEARAVSSDYRDAYAIKWSADGKHLLSVGGFEIIEIELDNPLFGDAATASLISTHRACPFWTEDGMVAAEWEALFTRVTNESQNHFSAQVYSRTQILCSRTDQNRCGYILCNLP